MTESIQNRDEGDERDLLSEAKGAAPWERQVGLHRSLRPCPRLICSPILPKSYIFIIIDVVQQLANIVPNVRPFLIC
jgi:hypothetical protein